jgi:rod shape determining protein RodA
VALLLLPKFAPVINGAQRWYAFPGFSLQPSELAKPAVVLALAALLRFEHHGRTGSGMLLPAVVASVPALLILSQPDLGSAMVLLPVLLAMCYAAGVPGKRILVLLGAGAVVLAIAYLFFLHGYQKSRVDVWRSHFAWDEAALSRYDVQQQLWGRAYQPWQALVAMGGGGLTGFGLFQGPQNRHDFLPYRSEDYIFAVIGEETGWLGCAFVLLLQMVLVLGILGIAVRSRERFGRLVCVGMAAWLGSQALVHAAVCGWMVPATGLPMPLISYGGSSTLTAVLGIGLCLNVGARREPVLAGDGYR